MFDPPISVYMDLKHALDPYGGDHWPLYWSSALSAEQDVTDTLQFKLVHPVCLVREVQIEPYIEDPEASAYSVELPLRVTSILHQRCHKRAWHEHTYTHTFTCTYILTITVM